jgi:hypothetical protein
MGCRPKRVMGSPMRSKDQETKKRKTETWTVWTVHSHNAIKEFKQTNPLARGFVAFDLPPDDVGSCARAVIYLM